MSVRDLPFFLDNNVFSDNVVKFFEDVAAAIEDSSNVVFTDRYTTGPGSAFYKSEIAILIYYPRGGITFGVSVNLGERYDFMNVTFATPIKEVVDFALRVIETTR
jgi:hypothetical protein